MKKSKAFKLTKENYFSKDRPMISNSQVSDYFKGREFYYKRHVLHENPVEPTANMRIGTLVDEMLCGSPPRYQVRVLKKDDPEMFEIQKNVPDNMLCTEREYEEAVNHAKAVMREPVYEFYRTHKAEFQYLLSGDVDGIPVCGLADVITETPDYIALDDFKVVGKLKVVTPSKWYFNIREMSYDRQLACYRFLYLQMHPDEKRPIICRHLVVTKMEQGLYRVIPFIIPDSMLEKPLEEWKRGVKGIAELEKTKDFIDPPVEWSDALALRDPQKELDSIQDDEQEEFV